MAEGYPVAVRVISQKGSCAAGHKVGEEWILEHNSPEGLCLSALDVLFPYARVLSFGGSFPWEDNPDVTTIACPDAENPVVFELRRLKE